MSELETESAIFSEYVTSYLYDVDASNKSILISRTTSLKTATRLKVAEYPWVWMYVAPVILLAGIIGNILTILIMRRRGMRGSTTSVYLSVLSFFDLCALITRIPPEFFKACDLFIFSDINRWTCKIEKFSFYTTSDIAIWLLVSFSVDRLVAVSWPFLKKTFCRPKRAMLVCFVITIVFVLKNLHVFWTRDVEYYPNTHNIKKVCGRPYPYSNFEEYVRPWIAFASISILPLVLISISNIAIVVILTKSNKHSSQSANNQLYRSASSRYRADSMLGKRTDSKTDVKRKHRFTQTTLMCIAASVCFLILVTPSIVLILGRVYWTSRKTSIGAYGVARAINYQLSCLNHAINFFLYCLTGERFRRQLHDQLCFCSNMSKSSNRLVVSSRKFSDAASSSAAHQDHAPPVIQPFVMKNL